jgi:hypothetical protein
MRGTWPNGQLCKAASQKLHHRSQPSAHIVRCSSPSPTVGSAPTPDSLPEHGTPTPQAVSKKLLQLSLVAGASAASTPEPSSQPPRVLYHIVAFFYLFEAST